MLLRLSLGLTEEADAVECAVKAVLNQGIRTADIAQDGMVAVGCKEMHAQSRHK